MTHGRAEIHELLLANDLRPSRALGPELRGRREHRPPDRPALRRDPGQRVVEIGAGLGSLTLALAEAGASVTAVEIDRHVLAVLRAQVEPVGVRVVEADALTLDWSELLDDGAAGHGPVVAGRQSALQRRRTPGHPGPGGGPPDLVTAGDGAAGGGGADGRRRRRRCLRRGVGEGGLLGHGGAGRPGVGLGLHPEAAGGVGAGSPRPSARTGGRGGGRPGLRAAYERLFSVVRAGFAHRRKMLRRSLDGRVAPEAFGAAGIRPTARAEELSLEEWERLAAWPGPADGRRRTGERGRPAHRCEVSAPAKLTLSLRVTGVRSDGYHLLESEMVTLDLADTLVIDDRESGATTD